MTQFSSKGWARLLARVRRRAGPAEAEDLLHAAWLRMHAYGQTRTIIDADAFLVRAAVNIGVDQHRRAKWFAPGTFEAAVASTAVDAPLQDEVIAARQRLARVREGVERLPPRTRQIFLMQRLDGLSYRQIAAELALSTTAVENHMARAIAFLTEWSLDF